jgi:hypothetical protein
LLGTLQRICAVLAWFQRFFLKAMRQQVPTAWDLVPPPLAWSLLPLQAGAAACLALGLGLGSAAWIRAGGLLGCGAHLSFLALVLGVLTRGRSLPFPDGVNPYQEWVRSQG